MDSKKNPRQFQTDVLYPDHACHKISVLQISTELLVISYVRWSAIEEAVTIATNLLSPQAFLADPEVLPDGWC